MGLFTLPPKILPSSDRDLFLFKAENPSEVVQRFKRGLPAEWYPQQMVQITWPHEGTDWAPMLKEVTECYLRLAYEIAIREPLLVVAQDAGAVERLLTEQLPRRAVENIRYFECPTNDTWARDHAFLTLLGTGGLEYIDFKFNGWGGKFTAKKDNAINRRLFEAGILSGRYFDRLHYELEGGSIESDGQGTILTTTCCLLNENRNGGATKSEAELALTEYLGAERVLWLEHGELAGDDTDGHIDTLARFCPNDTIAYVQCSDKEDALYASLQAMEEEIKAFRTAEGKAYRLVPLPMPAPIYDEDGERLPATYANFLIMNNAVLLPVYGQPANDAAAHQALVRAFPHYEIVDVNCNALIRQHGSLHCATMQYPKPYTASSAETEK